MIYSFLCKVAENFFPHSFRDSFRAVQCTHLKNVFATIFYYFFLFLFRLRLIMRVATICFTLRIWVCMCSVQYKFLVMHIMLSISVCSSCVHESKQTNARRSHLKCKTVLSKNELFKFFISRRHRLDWQICKVVQEIRVVKGFLRLLHCVSLRGLGG